MTKIVLATVIAFHNHSRISSQAMCHDLCAGLSYCCKKKKKSKILNVELRSVCFHSALSAISML